MPKIRKSKLSLEEENEKKLTASYFFDKANYFFSRDKIYNEFEADVYKCITNASNKGHYTVTIALKVYPDLSFDYNKSYKDIYKKLKDILISRGFKVINAGANYYEISWDLTFHT